MSGFLNFVLGDLILVTFPSYQIKCFLLVNDRFRPDAKRSFGTLVVKIVTGHHFLGGFLGDHSSWVQYVSGYGSGFTVPYKGC